MKKILNLKQYQELILPFFQKNLYEGVETALSEDKIPFKFDGPCSCLLKQNLIHQWWLSTVTLSEDSVFGVVNSFSEAQQITEVSKNCLSNYPKLLQFVRERLPFGLAQISSCHHQHHLFTPRPLTTCMMSQFFVPPSLAMHWFEQIQKQRLSWWKKFSSSPTSFSTSILKCDEGEHMIEIQFKFPWGENVGIEWIHHQASRPLQQLSQHTQVNLKGKDGRKSLLPHVIESFTLDHIAMFTCLSEAFREKKSKGGAKSVLHLHRFLAPYKVTITQSGSEGAQLTEIAKYLNKELRKLGLSVFYLADTSLTLEQQFKKFDQMGIPFCIVLSDYTLQNGILGLRSRDTTLQEQIHTADVTKFVKRYVTSIYDAEYVPSA